MPAGATRREYCQPALPAEAIGNDSFRIPVIPSASLACGTVVYVNGLVGVATRPIEANTYGEIQLVVER